MRVFVINTFIACNKHMNEMYIISMFGVGWGYVIACLWGVCYKHFQGAYAINMIMGHRKDFALLEFTLELTL